MQSGLKCMDTTKDKAFFFYRPRRGEIRGRAIPRKPSLKFISKLQVQDGFYLE
jgi:hypothetical protein